MWPTSIFSLDRSFVRSLQFRSKFACLVDIASERVAALGGHTYMTSAQGEREVGHQKAEKMNKISWFLYVGSKNQKHSRTSYKYCPLYDWNIARRGRGEQRRGRPPSHKLCLVPCHASFPRPPFSRPSKAWGYNLLGTRPIGTVVCDGYCKNALKLFFVVVTPSSCGLSIFMKNKSRFSGLGGASTASGNKFQPPVFYSTIVFVSNVVVNIQKLLWKVGIRNKPISNAVQTTANWITVHCAPSVNNLIACTKYFPSPPSLLSATQQPEVLALKHESKIFRQSSKTLYMASPWWNRFDLCAV